MTPERWQQITATFHAALLRDSGQRQSFLNDECGADEALRIEVEAMLGAHDNAGDGENIPAIADAISQARAAGIAPRPMQPRNVSPSSSSITRYGRLSAVPTSYRVSTLG